MIPSNTTDSNTTDYNNSWELKSHRSSKTPEMDSIIEFLLSEMRSLEIHTPDIHPKNMDKLKSHINSIVSNLLYTYRMDPYRYLEFHADSKKYKYNPSYKGFQFTYAHVSKVILKFLSPSGYIELKAGFKSLDDPKGSQLSKMRATQKLIDLAKEEFKTAIPCFTYDDSQEETVILKGFNPPKKKNVLKDNKTETIQPPREVLVTPDNDPTVNEFRSNLSIINARIAKSEITLDMTWDEFTALNRRIANQKSKDKKKLLIDLQRKKLHRIFLNERFDKGGRFYGGWWQNIPRGSRHLIRINGKDVVEVDFSCLHPSMLYAKEGIRIPKGDMYSLKGYPTKEEDPCFREFVKTLLLVLLNADNEDEAYKAIHSAVHREKGLKLPEGIPSTKKKDIQPIIGAFTEKHKKISQYFCSGIGIDLQFWDSQIAEKVMLHFAKHGYAVLPMHDSFISHHGLERELRKVMEDAFFDMFKVRCKLDLKYNSIEERSKTSERIEGPCEASLCEASLHELLAWAREYDLFRGSW